MIKKIFRLLKLFCFSFMLAVCIVMGVAVVIPKRKDEITIEVEMTKQEPQKDTTAVIKGIETGD